MQKITSLFVAIALGIGAFFFFQHFDIKGLSDLAVSPKDGSGDHSQSDPPGIPPVKRSSETIRIASFNIQVFGESKSAHADVMDMLARIVRRFDVVAIQEVRAKDQSIVPQFVDKINENGRSYDFVIGPRLGRSSSKEQYVFIFDMASVEVDRNQLYTVDDPDDLLHREPLVGWFRVRGPPTNEAFTFTLVNIHTDPDETKQELNALDDVYRAVLVDGRKEDDVIILGDLNVDDQHMGQLGHVSGIDWTVKGTPTNIIGTKQYDNIVYHTGSTTEFTGRAGVYDFMREFNLSEDEAKRVSDHMPIWAEFSTTEGGQPGRVATLPGH